MFMQACNMADLDNDGVLDARVHVFNDGGFDARQFRCSCSSATMLGSSGVRAVAQRWLVRCSLIKRNVEAAGFLSDSPTPRAPRTRTRGSRCGTRDGAAADVAAAYRLAAVAVTPANKFQRF